MAISMGRAKGQVIVWLEAGITPTELLMFAEGIGNKYEHQLAALKSSDRGRTWRVCQERLLDSSLDVGMGSPCIVPPAPEAGSNEWRVYCMKNKPRRDGDYPVSGHGKNQVGISMAVSKSGALGPYTWPGEHV
jgi:hypothetical protein